MALVGVDVIETMLVHTSTVEAHRGSSGLGELFDPPVVLPCFVEDEVRLVRTDTGAEVVSSTTVYYAAGADVPVGSRVTITGRPPSTVLTVGRRDSGGLSQLDHVEVALR